jgi:ribosome-associated toxin RatA of RatAB toxin-antitoxin module
MKHLLLVIAVSALIVSPGAASVNSLPLSDEQRARLGRGEVILFDVLPDGGGPKGGQGGTALALVRARPEAVWRLLVNYEGHSGLYPNVKEAEILESEAGHALVRYVVGVGPFSFRFHVDNYPSPAERRLVWRLAQGRSNGLFQDTWGYWQVDPHADGALVTYAMGARTVLPAFLTRGAERDGLVDTLKAVRARAERLP